MTQPHLKPHARGRRALARLVLASGMALGGVLMHTLLTMPGRLTRPPTSPAGWENWWSGRDPLDAVAAFAALGASLAIGWLVLASAIHLVASCWGGRRLRIVTGHLMPSTMAAFVAAAAFGSGPAGAMAAHLPPPAVVTDGTTPPTMAVLEAEDPTTSPPPTMSVEGGDQVEPPATRAEPSGMSNAPVGSVTVLPGDHLWAIAARRVQLATGSSPPPAAVEPYWLALIEANHDRLADPEDPDLLFPGQVLVLPG